MATRWENGPSVGDTETALGCVRAADTIPKLTVAQIVPFTMAYFENASGLMRPTPPRASKQNGLSAGHLRPLEPPAGHWAKCRPVGGLAFGDRIAEC